MKIRLGFVSNSSSSSFVIFYDDVEFHKIRANDGIFALGGGISDADDFFDIDDDILKLFEKNEGIRKCFKFFKVYHQTSSDDDRVLRKDLVANLPLSCRIRTINKSYHASQDVHDIKERYK